MADKLQGRNVLFIMLEELPRWEPSICICADCGYPAERVVMELDVYNSLDKQYPTWFWCGMCDIGG